jgi:hypothetical protein
MKKKILIGLVAGLAVFGAVYAVAASLTVTTNTVQAGSDTTATDFQCATGTLTNSYAVAWYANGGGPGYFQVNTVTVGGIPIGTPGACDGRTLSLAVTKDGVQQGSTYTFTIGTNNASATHAFDVSADHIKVSDVNDIHIALSN